MVGNLTGRVYAAQSQVEAAEIASERDEPAMAFPDCRFEDASLAESRYDDAGMNRREMVSQAAEITAAIEMLEILQGR